jgi:hypothetical protein
MLGAVDPQGGCVPDQADSGRGPADEPGILGHHVDGARVRQAHHPSNTGHLLWSHVQLGLLMEHGRAVSRLFSAYYDPLIDFAKSKSKAYYHPYIQHTTYC